MIEALNKNLGFVNPSKAKNRYGWNVQSLDTLNQHLGLASACAAKQPEAF